MGEQLSTKEATLPEIAITPGDDAEGNDHALDLTEALTDIEDLHEDQSEEKPYKNYRKSKLKILLKDADAGLTDMEDVEASDGDDIPDEIVKHKTPISLDSLDFDYNNFEEVQKPKHKKGKLERSISLSNNAAGNTLGLDKFNDDQDVTECENFPTSNEVSEDECDDLEDNPILKMYTDYENIVHSNEMKTNSVEMAASPKIANISNLLVPIQPKVPELTDVESLDSDNNARGDRKTRKKHRHSKCIISNNKQKYSSEYICKKRNGKNRTMKDKVVSVPTYVIKSTSDCEIVEFPVCKQIAKKRSITSSKSFTSQTELEDVETDEDIFNQKIIRRSISEDTLLKQMENFCLNAEEMSNQRTERANKNKLNKTSKPKKCKGGQCCPRNKAEGLQNKKSLAVVDTVEPLTDVEQISSSSEQESSSCTSNETSSDELSAEEGVIVLDDDTGCEIILPPAVRTLVITENDDYMKPVIKIVPLDDSEEFQKPKERIMDCLTEEEELQGDNIVESDHEAEEEEINLDYGVISVSEASSPAETKKNHKRPPKFREMHLKYLTATNVKSNRVTDIEDLSMSDDGRSDHIKQNYAHDSNGKGYNKLVSALQVTSDPSPVVTDTENLEDSTDDELGQEISQSKKVRKKCSKGTESVLYLRGGGCNLFDLECGRLLNKISILKFMPLVYKQIRSTDFEWDATAQSKLEPTEVKREEVVAQKEISCEPLTQASSQTVVPQPHPRVQKVADKVEKDRPKQVSPVRDDLLDKDEQESDTYSDKKKFWETITKQSDQKRMSLHEIKALENELNKKRASIHEISEPPQPKPRSDLTTSSESEDEKPPKLIETSGRMTSGLPFDEEDEVPRTEYQASFLPPQEQKPKQTIASDSRTTSKELEKEDSLDSDMDAVGYNSQTGYISDSGDVEHYISDSEIEDRVPQIRERQMSVFSPPVSTGKKSIYERSASLPTEDLYEVSARSIKLRKQYYEEQIKKEMIEEQLTSELEEETSPEKKSLPAFEEDEFESVPSLPEDKEPKKSVKDLAKKFDSLEDDASKAQSALKEASKTPTKEKEHLDKSEIEHSEKQGEHSPSKVGEEYIPEITVTLSGKQRRWSEESDETAKDEKPEISEISKEDHVKTQDKDVGIINKRTKFDEKSTVKEQEKFKKTKSKEEKTKDEKPQGKEQQLKDVKSAIKDERALSEDDKSIDKKIKDKKLKDEKSKDLKSKDQKPKEEKSKSQMVKDDKLKDEKTKAGKLKDQKTKDEELKDQKSKDRERDEPKDEKPKSKDVKLKSKELRSQVVEVKTKAKEEKSVTKDQKSHIKDAKVLTKGEDDKAKPQDQKVVAKDEKLENKMKDHVVDLNKFKKEHEKQVHETPKTNQDEEGVIKVSKIIDKKPIHSQKELKAAESTKLMTNKLEEHEDLKKVILAQPLCQPEEHDIQETVWEVSVQSEQRFDEKLMDIPTKEYVGLGVPQDPSTDKDDDLSSNARDESDLTSEIHQDHSDSLSDKIISDSHSDIEKIIMDSLHQQKVEPVEAKAIASALLEEIEEEIGKMDPLMSAVDETRTTFSESNKRQISEYLRKMAESKGLEDREIELVESVLARRQRELIKLARGDTQASSVEITDEDLRYSGGEADFPQLLEQQMDQLEAEKVDDIKAVYASIEEEQKQKDKSSTFDKIDEEQFTEKSSTQEYESYEKNGKTTHKKDTSITGYDRIKGEVFGSEKRNVILEEDESVLEVTSEEAAKVKGTSITDIQEDICSAGDKKLSQESHRSATKEHIEGESHRQSQIKDTYQNDREKQVSKIATTTEVRGGKQITTQDIKMDIEDTGLGIQQIATATLGKTQELCYEKQDEKSSATSEKMTLPDGRTLETMSEITEVSKTSKEETKDHVQELSQIVTLKEGDKTLPMKTKVDAMGRTSSSDSKSSVESSGRSAEDPFSSCSSGRKDEIGDGKIQTKVKLRKTKSEMDTSSSSSNLKPNRLSAIETEGHSSSGESYYHSFDSGRSRPCSSDVEGFFAGGSSEYESALTSQDTSIKSHITSGEYHTAISSLSSKESMKSLDSESSGNLASVEISEVSETIVPSSSDLEGDILDVQEHLLEELEQQPIVTEPPEFESKDSLEEIEEGQIFDVHSKMKRSCEMTFQPEPKVLLAESPQGESEEKFGTSLDEGSVLSISLSSTSSVQLPTVIELSRSDTPPGVSQKMYSSYEEVPSLSTSQADISTSTLLQHTDSPVDSVTIMTSKVEENGIYSVSTQVSSETRTDEPKKKGHRRQESSTIHFTKIETHKPQSDLTESDEYSGLGLKDDRKEDEQYQTEADQGFQKDMREGRYTVTHETHQRKKSHSEVSDSSEKSDKSSFEEAEAEAAFNMVAHVSPVHKVKQIIPILEDEAAEKDELETVERIKREKEKELELLRQKIRDQSPGSIPDIKVTEHMTPESASKTSSLDMDDQEKDAQKSTPETPASNSSKSSEETDQGREYILDDTTPSIREEAEETSESRIMTESRSEMGSTIIEKTTREETDSPNSDSFEMLEKPDLIDDFVVIEEVAKEAHECDAEGKSVKIQQKTTKRTIRKRTEDDEEPCVRSAPTPLTRMTDIKLYPDGSDELGFDFEESPPQPEENGRNRDYVREYNNELEANRQWIEQQFQGSQAATMAAGFGYEMEFERGPLEDIKEEDITDFDPSSRIGSLGSQKESGGSLGSVKDSYSSTPEYDVLAGKKYFTRSGENDDVSMSSLQEFENLERAMSLETKKFHQGSHSSSSNGSLKTKYGKSQGDDISVSSLKEFEGLEIACIAAHKIELKVKEEEALLSQIDEGQESIASESESCETVSVPEKRPPESDEEDYEKRMFEIDEIIKQAQTNVERFVDIKECEKTESLGRGDSVEEVSKVPDLDLDAPVVRSTIKVQFKESDDPMILSTDSLDCKVEESSRRGSTDSLDEKVPPADLMTTSTDSIEACSKRASEQITSDSLGRMVFSDSLELAAAANAAAAVLSDSIDEDGSRIGQDFSSSSTGRDFSSSVREDDPEQAGIPMEYMLGSTDSLEPTSSTATHATYQFESDSVFSGSFTSGGSNTMVSSTDTIDPMHVRETVDIAAAVKKVWFDENTDKEFTTEYLDYGSRPYVTEVIEPCDDGEYSHTIRRRVEMPPEIRKVTFQGPDAEEQLRRYMEEFGEGEFCQETEEVDADGNVHVKRVVQKRVIIKGGGAKPESLDEFQTEPGISKGSKDQPQLTKLTSDTGAVPKESSGFHHGRPLKRRTLRFEISLDDQIEVDPREHDWRFNFIQYAEDQPGADSLHESTSEVDQKSPKPEPEKRDQ